MKSKKLPRKQEMIIIRVNLKRVIPLSKNKAIMIWMKEAPRAGALILAT